MFLLGDAFLPEVKKRNFEFYDPLTTGDSSLSSCVEAIIAAQIGNMDKAIRYGMAALLMPRSAIERLHPRSLFRRLLRGRLRNFNQLRRPRFCCTCDQT